MSTETPDDGLLQVTAIRQLTAELPLNDFGLPTGIYRTDLLPFHDYVPPGSRQAEPPTPIVLPEISPRELEAAPGLLPDQSADAFSLLAGVGDGLPDLIQPARQRIKVIQAPAIIESTPEPVQPAKSLGDYRIAGFPAKSLHSAFVPLQYDEGFPAFEDGRPFWARLDYEPADAFLAFERYTQMNFGRAAESGIEDDAGEAASGIRSITSLVLLLHPQVSDKELIALSEKFKQYYHLYYWGMRIKAYDLFKVTEFRQKQELRAIETQDDHYITSRRLRARLMEYMDSDEDFWDLMTPKVAIDMLKTTTSLERISAGVPAGGPQLKDGESGGRSFEVQFRTIAQEQAGESLQGALINEEGDVLDKALDDPAATKILQELIIRSGGG